jgi:hypothetical protein
MAMATHTATIGENPGFFETAISFGDEKQNKANQSHFLQGQFEPLIRILKSAPLVLA